MNHINALTQQIIGAAIEVHRELGPGLLEHSYQAALKYELISRGLKVETEVEIPLIYKGVCLDVAFRADMIVEDEIIVELKATEKDNPLFGKQLFTYLRITNKRIGLLINFNRQKIIDGLQRIINSAQ